jgi:hypothetical protein
MLNVIRNHNNNKMDRTEWKDADENGYIFEDFCSIVIVEYYSLIMDRNNLIYV